MPRTKRILDLEIASNDFQGTPRDRHRTFQCKANIVQWIGEEVKFREHLINRITILANETGVTTARFDMGDDDRVVLYLGSNAAKWLATTLIEMADESESQRARESERRRSRPRKSRPPGAPKAPDGIDNP